MKNSLLFTYSANIVVRLLIVNVKNYLTPKNPKMCNPILVTLLLLKLCWKGNPIIVNPVIKMWPYPAANPHSPLIRKYPPPPPPPRLIGEEQLILRTTQGSHLLTLSYLKNYCQVEVYRKGWTFNIIHNLLMKLWMLHSKNDKHHQSLSSSPLPTPPPPSSHHYPTSKTICYSENPRIK